MTQNRQSAWRTGCAQGPGPGERAELTLAWFCCVQRPKEVVVQTQTGTLPAAFFSACHCWGWGVLGSPWLQRGLPLESGLQ